MQGLEEVGSALLAFALMAMSHRTTLLIISAATSMLLQVVPRTRIYDEAGQVDEKEVDNIQKFLLATGLVNGGLTAGGGVAGMLNGELSATTVLMALIGVQLALNTAMKMPWPAVASVGVGAFVGSNLPGYASFLSSWFSNDVVVGLQLGTGVISTVAAYSMLHIIKDVMAGGGAIMNLRYIAIPIAVIAAIEGILLTFGLSTQPAIESIYGFFASM